MTDVDHIRERLTAAHHEINRIREQVGAAKTKKLDTAKAQLLHLDCLVGVRAIQRKTGVTCTTQRLRAELIVLFIALTE